MYHPLLEAPKDGKPTSWLGITRFITKFLEAMWSHGLPSGLYVQSSS